MNLDHWANKIYAEKDFGRSVSRPSGSCGPRCTYLLSRDWVMSAFVTIIVFPLFRVVASAVHRRWKETHNQKLQTLAAQKSFEKFSLEEKKVIKAFVEAGGAALSYSQINRADVAKSAVESLVLRGILFNTVLSDGAEAFVMKTEVFDMGQQAFPKLPPSHTDALPAEYHEVPF